MIESIVKAFDGLLTDFSWRRLTAIIFFSLYVASVFAAYEAFTGHFRLSRIQQAADVAAKLQDIESKGFSSDSNLSRLHANLVRQLQESATPGAEMIHPPKSLWKFLAAVAPWLLLTTAYIFQPTFRRDPYTPKNPGAILLGLAALALITGITAIFVPTFLWPWGSLFIYPALTFTLFVVFVVAWHYRKQHSPKSA